jgi:hypothetical protein
MIPTLRSLPDPDALSACLADRYGLGFTGCTLLRSLVNDVYELTTGDARYILKLYRHDGRDPGRSVGRQGFRPISILPDCWYQGSCYCPAKTRSGCSRHRNDPARSPSPDELL